MKIKTPERNNQNGYYKAVEVLFDQYVDLGLEDFILKNKELLKPEMEELIGRIRVCQMLNIDILNKDGTPIDFLFEESFLYDKFTIELITTNDSYKYIDQEYKKVLEEESDNDILDIIETIKEYNYSPYSYKIGSIYISKNRLYKNLKNLLPYIEKEGLDRILFMAIIYKGCYRNAEIQSLLEMKEHKVLLKQRQNNNLFT